MPLSSVQPSSFVLNPVEKFYWEEHLANEAQLESQAEWLRYSRAHYAGWARKYLTGGRRVLKTDSFEEIRGGEILEALLERYQKVVVQDLARPALVQSAGRRHSEGLDWIQAPVQVQPFADDSFDGVVSFSTLDHFKDEREIGMSLRELARITRPGGELLITLDNGSNPFVACRNLLPNRLLQKLGLAPYEYGRTLRARAFQEMLGENGWRVKVFTAVVHEPRAMAVAMARYCHPGGILNPSRYRKILEPFAKFETLPTRMLSGYFLLALADRVD